MQCPVLMNRTLTAVEGLKVGHAHDERARTGCTVVLFEPQADIACEARGGWPGTYDTHSIDVTKTFVKKHAVFLTGGDIFGFDTAIGIRRYLLEHGQASGTGVGMLPGIVGANIYDVEFGIVQEARYAELGYSACTSASSQPVAEGNVGAGMGATVGKLRGMKFACKGGCGTSAVELPNDVVVGALVVTNALGNLYDNGTGKTIAGVRGHDGGFLEFEDITSEYMQGPIAQTNTTIGVVATNAELTHEELIKVAQMAHDGLAMSIRPVHMSTDGDTLFAVSTARKSVAGERRRIVDVTGYTGAQCVASAVVRSARAAQTMSDIPSCNDLAASPV